MLRKGAYHYEYMNNWEEFIEISLPEKKDFYIHLNMEGISDADYVHAKKVCKNFKIRNLCDYHDLYVQIYTLLLVDVFENFRNKCLKLYYLDPAFSAPRLSW